MDMVDNKSFLVQYAVVTVIQLVPRMNLVD